LDRKIHYCRVFAGWLLLRRRARAAFGAMLLPPVVTSIMAGALLTLMISAVPWRLARLAVFTIGGGAAIAAAAKMAGDLPRKLRHARGRDRPHRVRRRCHRDRTRLAGRSHGVVTGDYSIEFEDDPQPGDIVLPFGMVWFNAKKFACRTCGLRLDSTLEMSTAGNVCCRRPHS
jgi:hypothetical protein